jgi:hypothetical protein
MRVQLAVVLVATALVSAGCHQMDIRGAEGQRVVATTPRSLSIHRGESVPLTVSIDRQNFSGPVTVSVSQLPKGVDADRPSMTVETTSATIVLKASSDAVLVKNQALAVAIEDGAGRRALQYVDLSVTD